jgi:hypothetical protein
MTMIICRLNWSLFSKIDLRMYIKEDCFLKVQLGVFTFNHYEVVHGML